MLVSSCCLWLLKKIGAGIKSWVWDLPGVEPGLGVAIVMEYREVKSMNTRLWNECPGACCLA